jgi:hypothetical protein
MTDRELLELKAEEAQLYAEYLRLRHIADDAGRAWNKVKHQLDDRAAKAKLRAEILAEIEQEKSQS